MRVLHVTSTFPRSDGDFTGPFMAGLCVAERDAGLEVRVVAPHATGVGEVGGVAVRRFRYGPSRAEILAYRGGLLAAARSPAGAAMIPPYLAAMTAVTVAEVRTWRPDVVHAHWWFPGGAVAAVAARLTGRPFLVTLHGSDVALARRPALGRLAGSVLGRAEAVVAVSEALAAEAAAVIGLPGADIGVAVMPVEVGPSAGGASAGGGLHRPRMPPTVPGGSVPVGDRHASGSVRAVAVGRLAPEKGFDVLIDGAARAAAGGLDLEVELVGAGPELDALRHRAATAGAPVRFPGALAPEELHRRMAAADVVVVPSRREGLGLVAVEAIMLGRPVIASHTGGLPGVLGAAGSFAPAPGEWVAVDGGALVPAGDVDGLAAALAAAGALPAPGPTAVAGTRRHRPAAVAEDHRRLYEEVLARWSQRGRQAGR